MVILERHLKGSSLYHVQSQLQTAHLMTLSHIEASAQHAVQRMRDQAAVVGIHQAVTEDAQVLMCPQPCQGGLGVWALQVQDPVLEAASLSLVFRLPTTLPGQQALEGGLDMCTALQKLEEWSALPLTCLARIMRMPWKTLLRSRRLNR